MSRSSNLPIVAGVKLVWRRCRGKNNRWELRPLEAQGGRLIAVVDYVKDGRGQMLREKGTRKLLYEGRIKGDEGPLPERSPYVGDVKDAVKEKLAQRWAESSPDLSSFPIE